MRKFWPDSQSWHMTEPETEIRSSKSCLYQVETLCFSLVALLEKEPPLVRKGGSCHQMTKTGGEILVLDFPVIELALGKFFTFVH